MNYPNLILIKGSGLKSLWWYPSSNPETHVLFPPLLGCCLSKYVLFLCVVKSPSLVILSGMISVYTYVHVCECVCMCVCVNMLYTCTDSGIFWLSNSAAVSDDIQTMNGMILLDSFYAYASFWQMYDEETIPQVLELLRWDSRSPFTLLMKMY